MSNFKKFKEILDDQEIKGIKSQDWEGLKDYKIVIDNKDIIIYLDSVDIGMVFNKKTGKLKGIFNFKE